MLLPVLVIPIIILFISLVKLWIISISMVETFVIVARRLSVWTFKRYSGLIQILMNLIYFIGMTGFGQ